MAGFKSQEKRRRELAKLDKRRVKDEKRAQRRAERSASLGTAPAVAAASLTAATPPPKPAVPSRKFGAATVASPAAAEKPLTLAEAVERWKATKIVKAKPHR